MNNISFLRDWKGAFAYLYGLMLIILGVYTLSYMVNIMVEDINHNFNLLRLVYTWQMQYFAIHLWLYSALLIIGGVLIIIKGCIKSVEFIIIGLFAFFFYTLKKDKTLF